MLDGLGYLDPVHFGHFQVGENKIVIVLANEPQRFGTPFHGIDAEACENEDFAKTVQNDFFIINGQYPGFWVVQVYPLQASRFFAHIEFQPDIEGLFPLLCQARFTQSFQEYPKKNIDQDKNNNCGNDD